MSMTKIAAGVGAAALALTLSFPATAVDRSQRMEPTAGSAAMTDISAAKRHHRYHRNYVRHYRAPRYGVYHRPYWGYPRYGYYGPYYGGPSAYVSLPFGSFSIW